MTGSTENTPLRPLEARSKPNDPSSGSPKQNLSPLATDTQAARRPTVPDSATGPSPNTPVARPTTTPEEAQPRSPSITITNTDADDHTRPAETADIERTPRPLVPDSTELELNRLTPPKPRGLPSKFDFNFKSPAASLPTTDNTSSQAPRGNRRPSGVRRPSEITTDELPSIAEAGRDTTNYEGVLNDTGMHPARRTGEPAPDHPDVAELADTSTDVPTSRANETGPLRLGSSGASKQERDFAVNETTSDNSSQNKPHERLGGSMWNRFSSPRQQNPKSGFMQRWRESREANNAQKRAEITRAAVVGRKPRTGIMSSISTFSQNVTRAMNSSSNTRSETNDDPRQEESTSTAPQTRRQPSLGGLRNWFYTTPNAPRHYPHLADHVPSPSRGVVQSVRARLSIPKLHIGRRPSSGKIVPYPPPEMPDPEQPATPPRRATETSLPNRARESTELSGANSAGTRPSGTLQRGGHGSLHVPGSLRRPSSWSRQTLMDLKAAGDAFEQSAHNLDPNGNRRRHSEGDVLDRLRRDRRHRAQFAQLSREEYAREQSRVQREAIDSQTRANTTAIPQYLRERPFRQMSGQTGYFRAPLSENLNDQAFRQHGQHPSTTPGTMPGAFPATPGIMPSTQSQWQGTIMRRSSNRSSEDSVRARRQGQPPREGR